MPNYKRYYLKEYSYIFITIKLNKLVRQNDAPYSILTENINLLRQSFFHALSKYNFEIVAICIMKDHIHMIIKENELKNFSKIVCSIKKYFSYNLKIKPQKENLSQSMQKRKESGIWQRRFYDHIIRNEEDFNKHLDYIHYNSVKHYGILPKDWKYSSFKKFVKLNYYNENWCDFKYNGMELE